MSWDSSSSHRQWNIMRLSDTKLRCTEKRADARAIAIATAMASLAIVVGCLDYEDMDRYRDLYIHGCCHSYGVSEC